MTGKEQVSGNRLQITFFGMRNAGKSSLVNAVTGQELSIVSDVKGTTTDAVRKAMELLPLGAVVITDTAGLDDEGDLGKERVRKAKQELIRTDIAVLVTDATREPLEEEKALLNEFKDRKIPYIIVRNKADLGTIPWESEETVFTSAKNGTGIEELKEKLGKLKIDKKDKKVVADLIKKGDTVLLVIPIDESAPKDRIILPQQIVIRELLEKGVSILCCRDTEVVETIEKLKDMPNLVITDSQVFGQVEKNVPEDVPLTSFSILFARYKGELESLTKGAEKLKSLKTGDKVLIAEGCTHHRQCNDIGTVKMPNWIKEYTGETPEFAFVSGREFPENLKDFALVVHCGGCMITETEMKNRIKIAEEENIPVVNYGIAIATMKGILDRSTEIFKSNEEEK
ncbi:MAG: [FeFe] hydrogenase H-cluster maturation GTPase HydF [Clostridia bacterium]|nr:[FeFe] hydrogenase H-cluster maturation GTPase HydF [Clostridia bacterium]